MTINLLHHYHHRQVPEGGLQHRLGPHGGERLAKPGDRHRDQRADHEQEPSDKDHCFQTSCLHHRQVSFLCNRHSVKSDRSTFLYFKSAFPVQPLCDVVVIDWHELRMATFSPNIFEIF